MSSSEGYSDCPESPGSLKDFIVSDDFVEYDTEKRKRENDDDEEEFLFSDQEDDNDDEGENDDNTDSLTPYLSSCYVQAEEEDTEYVQNLSAEEYSSLRPRRSKRQRRQPERYLDVEHYKKYVLADDADFLSDEADDDYADASIRTDNEDSNSSSPQARA